MRTTPTKVDNAHDNDDDDDTNDTMPDVLYGAHTTSDKTCWDTLQKYLFFPVLPGKNGNRRQMNDHPSFPYLILFSITQELHTLVSRPKQQRTRGGEGAYFFCLKVLAVWHKRYKINELSQLFFSEVVA